MLKQTSEAVQAAMKQGKSLDQMKKDKILAQWDGKYSGKNINSDLFIETIYDSLTNQKTAPFVKHN
jgi:hypothetical protein